MKSEVTKVNEKKHRVKQAVFSIKQKMVKEMEEFSRDLTSAKEDISSKQGNILESIREKLQSDVRHIEKLSSSHHMNKLEEEQLDADEAAADLSQGYHQYGAGMSGREAFLLGDDGKVAETNIGPHSQSRKTQISITPVNTGMTSPRRTLAMELAANGADHQASPFTVHVQPQTAESLHDELMSIIKDSGAGSFREFMIQLQHSEDEVFNM
jgi:hypothetical protein